MRIVSAATGKVADVANCGTADGDDVRQWTWLNNNCQQWQPPAHHGLTTFPSRPDHGLTTV